MQPSLRLFDGIALPSYGLMLFLSFLFGVLLFDRRVQRQRLLPKMLKYNWAWYGTDSFIALIFLLAAIWVGLFACHQWPWLNQRAPSFQIVFRVIAVLFAGYLIYGSISHMLEHRRTKEIESVEFTTYLAMWVLFSAIAGSRLLYVVLHWSEFSGDPIGIVAFWRGGLNGLIFYGGFIGALVAGLVFASANRMSLLKMLDAAIPSIMLGEFFTRIGCFLNGCCFGKACSLPWAVRFPPNSPAGILEAPLHPTQLYSSLAGLILFVVALVLERRIEQPRMNTDEHGWKISDSLCNRCNRWISPRNWRAGMLFGVVLLLYSLFRFGIDFVRYYENNANLWTNQAIALVLAGIAVAVVVISKRSKNGNSPPSNHG